MDIKKGRYAKVRFILPVTIERLFSLLQIQDGIKLSHVMATPCRVSGMIFTLDCSLFVFILLQNRYHDFSV